MKMINCNWLITDWNNKVKDCIAFIKATTHKLSEDRALRILQVKKCNIGELSDLWKTIPDQYKNPQDNLGGK